MKAMGTLQNCGNKDRVPEGTIWDSFAHKQDLELCVRAGKVLMLQLPPPPSNVSMGKVMGLPGATHCCRMSPLMPNEFIMNNVTVINTAQGLFLILNND